MAGSLGYREIVDAYADVRPTYERLAARIAEVVKTELVEHGMVARVEHRAKDVASFAKKALRKGYSDPINEIGDKAGVRVSVRYSAEVARVEEALAGTLVMSGRESKLDALDYDQFGYGGVHWIVRLSNKDEDAALSGLTAELQIHTNAQSAWAEISHDLLYKSPVDVPDPLKRTIVRLVALVELFDGEAQRFRQETAQHPDYAEMQVVAQLDDELIKFTRRLPDRRLSAVIVPPLVRLYDVPPADVWGRRLAPFIEERRATLDQIFARYRDDERANPLLYQPEAFLIFERLERDRDHLRESWPTTLPLDLLENMASIWGVSVE